MLAACQGLPTTREMRIGADDGTDSCRPHLVTLDSTGNFFAEDIIKGAVIGAVGGALIGALVSGGRGSSIAAGAVVGGAAGALGGYYAALRQQESDQARLYTRVSGDLARENAEIDKTQLAFDQLMDCRWGQAEQIRADLRARRIDRAEAERRMAVVRQRAQRDVEVARRIDQKINDRSAQFVNASEEMGAVPKGRYAARQAPAGSEDTIVRTADMRLRPSSGAPKVSDVPASTRVRVLSKSGNYALVEAPSGRRGYVTESSLSSRARSAPVREAPRTDAGSTAAPSGTASESDVRRLQASNISRRDNFSDQVLVAEGLASSGFDLETRPS